MGELVATWSKVIVVEVEPRRSGLGVYLKVQPIGSPTVWPGVCERKT